MNSSVITVVFGIYKFFPLFGVQKWSWLVFENMKIIVMQENCVLHKPSPNISGDVCCPLQQFIHPLGPFPISSQTNNRKSGLWVCLKGKWNVKWNNSETFDRLHLCKHLWVLQVVQIHFCRNIVNLLDLWNCGPKMGTVECCVPQEGAPWALKYPAWLDSKGAVGCWCWRERLGHFLDAASSWEGAAGVHPCIHSQGGWSQKMSGHKSGKEMGRGEVAEGWDSPGRRKVSGNLATQLSLCLLCVFCGIFK